MKGRIHVLLGRFFRCYFNYLLPLVLIKQKLYQNIPNFMVLAGSFSLLTVPGSAPVQHFNTGVSSASIASPFMVVFDRRLNRYAAAGKVVELLEKRFSRHPLRKKPARSYVVGPPGRIVPNRKITARARSDPVPV